MIQLKSSQKYSYRRGDIGVCVCFFYGISLLVICSPSQNLSDFIATSPQFDRNSLYKFQSRLCVMCILRLEIFVEWNRRVSVECICEWPLWWQGTERNRKQKHCFVRIYCQAYSAKSEWKRKKWAGGIRRRQQIQWLRGSERERESWAVFVFMFYWHKRTVICRRMCLFWQLDMRRDSWCLGTRMERVRYYALPFTMIFITKHLCYTNKTGEFQRNLNEWKGYLSRDYISQLDYRILSF